MPQINLLSPSFGKKAKKPKAEVVSSIKKENPLTLSYVVIGIIIVLMISIWVIMGTKISKYTKELKALEQKEATFTVEPQKLIKLNEQRDKLLKRLTFLGEFTQKKMLWSEKLERTAELIPEGVWLTDLSFEKRVNIADIEGNKSMEEKSVISIKGRAVAQIIQEAVELVGAFRDRLAKDEVFSRGFKEIKLNSLTKGVVASRDIMNFEFYCVLE